MNDETTTPPEPVKSDTIYQAAVMVGDTISRIRTCLTTIGEYIEENKANLPPVMAEAMAGMITRFRPDMVKAEKAETDLRTLAAAMRLSPLEDKQALVASLRDLLSKIGPEQFETTPVVPVVPPTPEAIASAK